MRPPDELRTQRLVLRRPRVEDAEAIFADYAQDPEVTRYVMWLPHPNVDVTRRFIETCIANWEGDATFNWVIALQGDDRPLGMIEIILQGHRGSLGYVLARPHWGQGIISEAAQAVVQWALSQPEIYRVWAVCDVENPASARVMEKCGMSYEGTLRRWAKRPNAAEPSDCLCYAITR